MWVLGGSRGELAMPGLERQTRPGPATGPGRAPAGGLPRAVDAVARGDGLRSPSVTSRPSSNKPHVPAALPCAREPGASTSASLATTSYRSRLTAERMGVAPERCVVVEDSVPGVRAARAARMRAVGYIGANGAGKSTTIKMLTGILVPTGGSIRVAGVDPSRNRLKLAKRIGVVFGQRTTLWWDLPLKDSFAVLQKMYGVPRARHRENLATFVELLDLGDLLLGPPALVDQPLVALGQLLEHIALGVLEHMVGVAERERVVAHGQPREGTRGERRAGQDDVHRAQLQALVDVAFLAQAGGRKHLDLVLAVGALLELLAGPHRPLVIRLRCLVHVGPFELGLGMGQAERRRSEPFVAPSADPAGALDPILARLSPRDRELLLLAYVEGFTHKEIAGITGLMRASVKPLLFRARQRFAAALRVAGITATSMPGGAW